MRALMSAYSSSQARRRRSSSRGDSALPISDSIILSGRRKQSLSGAERSGARAQRDGSGRDDRGAVRHGVVAKAGVLGPGTLVVFSLLLPSRAAGSRTRDGAARTRAAPSADSGAYRRARNGGSGAGTTREVSQALPVSCTHKRLHTPHLVTLFGTVSIPRMAYGSRGQPSLHPLDAQLQLPARRFSYEIQRRLVKSALQGPFDEALEVLADTTGIVVPKRTAEQIVADASADFESFYARRSAGGAVAQGPLLVAALDSKGIPMVKPEGAIRPVRLRKGEKRQKKRMSTVAAVFSQLPAARTPETVVASLFTPAELAPPREPRANRPQHKRVWASLLAGKVAFIQDVRDEVRRRDPDREHTWVIVTDGEP